jgi:hypothetical protein
MFGFLECAVAPGAPAGEGSIMPPREAEKKMPIIMSL